MYFESCCVLVLLGQKRETQEDETLMINAQVLYFNSLAILTPVVECIDGTFTNCPRSMRVRKDRSVLNNIILNGY